MSDESCPRNSLRYLEMNKIIVAGLVAAASLGTFNAGAQTVQPPGSGVSVLSQARIGRDVAEKRALRKVPGGRIKEAELEREHGKLVWSFDITKTSTPNVTEVQIDAKTGKVVSVAVETPADQAKEAASDAARGKLKP